MGGPIASLAPGATDSTTFTATLTIDQADVDAGMVENQATAEGTPPSGPPVTDMSDESLPTEDDPTVTPLGQNPSIALIKVGTLNGTGAVNDTIDYAFTVTNTGDVTLTGVTVTDPLVTVMGGPIASLAPGATDSTTFTATLIIDQDDVCLLYTSPSPRDLSTSRMPSSA